LEVILEDWELENWKIGSNIGRLGVGKLEDWK
jgi:hypothetical protein